MITKRKHVIRRNENGKRIPKSSDSCNYILSYLMSYSLCVSDKDYTKRAVDSLLKRLLRCRKQDVDELIESVTFRGSKPTNCITVPRTMDGRFQVAARKGYPHMVYTRIWRWGDLQNYQVTHIPTCHYGFDLKRNYICINPYHYRKVTALEELACKGESCSQDDIGQKNQDEPEQQQQESEDTQNLEDDELIPIVVEHQIDGTECNEPQEPLELANEESSEEPHSPESANDNNNIESTNPPSSINNRRYSNNLHNSCQPEIENSNGHNDVEMPQSQEIQQNQNNFMQAHRNTETPAISLSLCEQVLLDQSDFQNLSLSNVQRQNNFQQNINLPAPSLPGPSSTLIVSNPPLIPNCSQQSQDLVQSSNVGSVYMNEMPPPSTIPISRTPMFSNNNQQPQNIQNNFRPLPCSTPLPNNGIPLPCSTPLPNNLVPLPCSTPLPNNGIPLPCSTPLPNNLVPLPCSTPLPNNGVPSPCITPLPNNSPPLSQHFYEDFQSTETQHKNELANCNRDLQNKDTNPLSETFEQILSEVKNKKHEQLRVDQNFQNENALVDSNSKEIPKSNIDQLPNCKKELPSNNAQIVVNNYMEVTEQNNNQPLQAIANDIAPLSPISRATTPLSPINSIMSLSPIKSTVKPLSPVKNLQLSPGQLQCDSSDLLLLDNNNKKNKIENNKLSRRKERLQSDENVFLNETLQEEININTNARQNASQYFNDSMISFINNNIMEQTRMSTVSKCEKYLLNESGVKDSLRSLQPPTNRNSNNNPHSCNGNNHQALENDGQQMQTCDKELQQFNMNAFFNIPNLRRARNSISFDNAPLEHWCSIDYFELDTQVGDTFKVKNEYTTVVVDGYLDPDSGNRFCLGRLTNVSRTAQSERTRMHIAQGITLELRKDGDIWLRCNSKNSVFIQAHFLDLNSESTSRNTVHKIFPGNYKKVFDLQRCYKHIKAQIATAQAAFKAKQRSLGTAVNICSGPKGLGAMGMNVDDLRRLCILQISFVKGWGSDYPRDNIKETPCWIEVHVSRALQMLDEFLLLDKPIVRGMD